MAAIAAGIVNPPPAPIETHGTGEDAPPALRVQRGQQPEPGGDDEESEDHHGAVAGLRQQGGADAVEGEGREGQRGEGETGLGGGVAGTNCRYWVSTSIRPPWARVSSTREKLAPVKTRLR